MQPAKAHQGKSWHFLAQVGYFVLSLQNFIVYNFHAYCGSTGKSD